jgi:hypothetical protein
MTAGNSGNNLLKAQVLFTTPLKMGDISHGNNIAKPFFDPSSGQGKTLMPPRKPQDHLSVSTTWKQAEQGFALMALPVEIRILIYEMLLVGRPTPKQGPLPNTRQNAIFLHMLQHSPRFREAEPAILRTCKQIYKEALPILYSHHVFRITAPEEMMRLMAQIGPTNTKLIRALDIWVPADADIFPWLALLDVLSKKASGLRLVEIGWGSKFEGLQLSLLNRPKGRGLGDNVHFVRTLASIRGLNRLILRGYYAKHWPSYLTKMTGAQVQAEAGHWFEIRADDDPETKKWKHDLNEGFWQNLADFQEGTENLVPR